MAKFVVVARVGEIADGEARTVAGPGKRISVFNDRGEYFAIDDMCPHMGASLAGGFVENGIVTCPWHYWRFRLNDGAWADNPRIKIGCYPVHVIDDEIRLEVPRTGGETVFRARFMLTGLLVIVPTLGQAQAPSRPAAPKLEPIAEAKLLMEGLAHPNFKALDRMLKEGPVDSEAWQFARGQSLLLAETANLLMLRPPKAAKAEAAWMARATEFRDAAVKLAKTASAQDVPKSQAALLGLATSCNRCHETFRVETRIKVSEK